MSGLTHLDERGQARIVDVSEKSLTVREAEARGAVYMLRETLALIAEEAVPKGDVLAAARIAGILAAKATSTLIPLCHPLPLSAIHVDLALDEEHQCVQIVAHVRTVAQTGVEMEALTAVSIAGLTIYDMCKAVDKNMSVGNIRVTHKVKRAPRSSES